MIKKFIPVLFLLTSCMPSSDPFAWIEKLPSPWTLSETDFDFYLKKFQDQHPDFHERLKAINLWRVGTPYGLYCLGEEDEKDNDPIIRYDSSDCTVHVLTTLAFTEGITLKEARSNMISIHYKPNQDNEKVPDYNLRWHFTSDRILNHPLTTDITSSLVDSGKLEIIEIDLNKKQNGQEFLDLGWTSRENISFIPSENMTMEIMSDLPEVCGAAFVKRDYFKLGIVIAHEGYVIDRSNLIHASSEFGRTVNVNLLEYMKKDGKYRFDGIMFYEIRPM